MAPNVCSKGKEKATARAKMLTSVINRCLLLDRDHRKGSISDRIRGLIPIYDVPGIKDERAWDMFLDAVDFISSHESPLFTIPVIVPTPQVQEFFFSGVVRNLPVIYGANI